MTRITISILITILVGVLSGCSVFGIATKSELEAAMAREAQSQRVVEGRLEALDGRLATVAEDLDRFEQRLQPELVRLDSTVARNAREMELITARWAGVREQLKADVDSLRASHALVMDEVVWLRDDLDLARGDITRMGARADHARLRSQQALQIHYDTIVRERARLERRLLDLDQRLAELSAIGADSTVTVPLDSGPVPEESTEDEGKVEIRGVTSRD
jgi:chaperonin cofactor prefoldin